MPLEVFDPAVAARVEEADDLSSIAVDPCDIGSFSFVAAQASDGQILANRLAAMLLGDDVIELEREKMICLRQLTILTEAVRPVSHRLFE